MHHPAWVRTLFTDQDLDDIAATVERVERATSAELRVHLERRLPRGVDPLRRAEAVFQRLGMHRTRGRNGVLVYLALDDHKLAVLGDEAIHARVGPAYWERVRDSMVGHLRAAAPRDALVLAVEELGRVLAEHFPQSGDDEPDELSNRVSTE
ncbi:MAG: TPM domain-containing protein [Candidatus Rokubacteria bacterium]|nr:TPM domain-containing protein [Candidatus Rokubacteria bacterium]